MDYYDLITGAPHKGFKQCKHSLAISRGGSLDENRRIVRSKADVLLNPITSGKLTVDSAVVEIAKQRGVTIAIGFSQFLRASSLRRARLISAYGKLIQLCLKMKVRVLLVSDASSEWEARAPEQLIALGVLLGLSEQQAKWSITKVPAALVKGGGYA